MKKWVLRFAYSVLAFFYAACSGGCTAAKSPIDLLSVPGDSFHVVGAHGDPLALAAAADWMAHVPELHIDFVDAAPDNCANCIYIVPGTMATINPACFGVDHALGCTLRLPYLFNSASLIVASDCPENMKPEVWLHEMGHALGLVHTGPGTVMCASFQCAAKTVTAADVAQYELVRGRS
jgi:hypothetical protein